MFGGTKMAESGKRSKVVSTSTPVAPSAPKASSSINYSAPSALPKAPEKHISSLSSFSNSSLSGGTTTSSGVTISKPAVPPKPKAKQIPVPAPTTTTTITPTAVPAPTGGSCPNFSGKWYLDRAKSDSTDKYLEAMGLPLIARQAADKLNLIVVIQQSDSDFTISRRTKIFKETKPLRFNQEVVVKNTTIKVVANPTSIVTTSNLANKIVLLDTRTLEDGGNTMKVSLELKIPGQETVLTVRYFNKGTGGIDDSDDEEFLHEDPQGDASTSKRRR